ncbi:lasso peptide biosynthesis B2 protein [Steroidobacter denitrificans]|uniref:lasso peptide biosynthesis B2 protein n=1 Tax=Steroidobacter denitrificans TaxID=465721 RepID=UPI00083695E9|nr:lasso peptide biosynthesis B2 protein [Steroidobacter denitrificans]
MDMPSLFNISRSTCPATLDLDEWPKPVGSSNDRAPNVTRRPGDGTTRFERLPTYWLPAHVYTCHVPGGTVFLDLRRNRYLGVGEAETQTLQRHVANWQDATLDLERDSFNESTARHILDALVESALLQTESECSRIFSSTSTGLQEARHGLETVRASHRSIRAPDLWRFLRSCLWAHCILRTSSLYDAAHAIEDFRQTGGSILSPADPAQTYRCVQIFRRLRPYVFAAQDRCLFQALALVRFLQYYQTPATWIIGVRVRPWAAHSWVQQDELILDGTPESVREYIPILAVEA